MIMMLKNMRIKFDADGKLPLNKTIKISIITIVVKYYPQVFLDEFLYEI